MTKKYSTILWAGSDEAFDIFASAESKAQALDAAVYSQTMENNSSILDVQNGVGIIQIKGVLTNVDSWYNEYVGLISYNAIQEALYLAVADPAVKEILVDMGSPGGSVYGVTEALAAMDSAASVKPLTLFSDTVMASAAIWLGVPAWKTYVGVLASIGSIGVIAKHVEFSKMRAEAGITETIIRAGEFKQLANSSEPLTEKARGVIKESTDYAYGVFVQSMADYLGKSYQEVDTKMAQGREFTGQQAVDIGLVDAVSTFDEVFATMQTRIHNNESNGGDMKKKTLMSKAVTMAAAASGVAVPTPDGGGSPKELAAAAVLKADGAEAALEAGDTTSTEALAAATLRAEADELTAKVEQPAEPESGSAMDLLKTQLKEKDDEIFALKTDLATANVSAESVESLKEIGAKAINNMVVALGGTELNLSASSAGDIVTQHAATSERFMSEFRVGGVAATSSDDDDTESVETITPVSRMSATRSGMAHKA